MIVTFYHTTHNLVSGNGYHHLITLVTQVGYLTLNGNVFTQNGGVPKMAVPQTFETVHLPLADWTDWALGGMWEPFLYDHKWPGRKEFDAVLCYAVLCCAVSHCSVPDPESLPSP